MEIDNQYVPTAEDEKTKALLCQLCHQFYTLGWVTGTGGSISIKNSENKIFMSPSGVQKERMVPDDIYALTENGDVLREGVNPDGIKLKLSQCHPLFMSAYLHRRAGAVIHTHSIHAVMVSLLFGDEFRATHMEMIKGIEHHGYLSELVIPIIDNTPQEEDLRDSLTAALLKYPKANAVIVRRHGVYVWGRDWRHAKAQCECLDYCMQLAVEMRKLGMDPSDSQAHRPLALESKLYSGGCCHTPEQHSQKKRKHTESENATNSEVKAIIMDIEGTTTPIDFVTVTMFGYARTHVEAFLRANLHQASTQNVIRQMADLAQADLAAGAAGAVAIHADGSVDDETLVRELVNSTLWLMSSDRKVTPLKALQGLVWEAGFANGALVGEFYSDVQPSLDSWHRRGYKLCVYSSGSVHAQKNLFSHPKGHSSMLHYISDHFDTTVGGKRDAESYTKIAKHIAMEPRSIMFLTDIFEEAVAADAAGYQVTLLVRPGNAPLPDTHTFATAQSFVDLQL